VAVPGKLSFSLLLLLPWLLLLFCLALILCAITSSIII
jgi:hypothetical protein